MLDTRRDSTCDARCMRDDRGITLIEMIVVVVLLGIVAATAGIVRPGLTAHTDAAVDLARRVAVARWHAVASGRTDDCLPRDLADRPHSAVRETWPARGLAFTVDGLPRACDGGGIGNATILLEHRGRRAAVVVSSLGRVRWERR